MDNRAARIGALRSYIAVLRQEENLLSWLKKSPAASEQELAEAETELAATARKITNADRELRGLEHPG